MRTTVYRASRVIIFHAAFLLACSLYAWFGPTCALAPSKGSLGAGLMAWAAPMLLIWDAWLSLRGRPMYFKGGMSAKVSIALLLGIGSLGICLLANCTNIDALISFVSSWVLTLSNLNLPNSGMKYLQWMSLLGWPGVALMLIYGRRPPAR